MDAMGVVASALGGALSSALVSFGLFRWLADTTKERWLAAVRAEYDVRLETVKDQLGRLAHVSKAQWDLELSAYKDVWGAVGQLRNDCRSLVAVRNLPIPNPATQEMYLKESFAHAMKAFHQAHNLAIISVDRHAPFYPESVKRLLRAVTAADMDVISFYAANHDWFSDDWFQSLTRHIDLVTLRISQAEDAIRQRLSSIRVQ